MNGSFKRTEEIGLLITFYSYCINNTLPGAIGDRFRTPGPDHYWQFDWLKNVFLRDSKTQKIISSRKVSSDFHLISNSELLKGLVGNELTL